MQWCPTKNQTNLGNGVFDNLLVRHIALVTHQKLVNAFGCVAVNFLQPLLDVVERVHVGHIVNDADAVGTAIVRGCDSTETLLAGGIPLVPCLAMYYRTIILEHIRFEASQSFRQAR